MGLKDKLSKNLHRSTFFHTCTETQRLNTKFVQRCAKKNKFCTSTLWLDLVIHLKQYQIQGFQRVGYDFWHFPHSLLTQRIVQPHIHVTCSHIKQKMYVICNFNHHIRNESLLEVTASHAHCKSRNISKIVQNRCCY